MLTKTTLTRFLLRALAILAALPAVDSRPAAAQAMGVDPVLVWCRSSIEALNVAETRANEARYFTGPDAELAALEAGLAQAEQNSFPGSTGPLTLTAIRRGRVFASSMRSQYGQTSGGNRTIAHFLHEYYGFIRKVANEIDMPYFIPQTYCERCRPTIPDYSYELERRNVDFAALQLKLALEKMATGQGGMIFPIGPADAPSDGFLTVLKLSAAFVVEDLRPSLYGSPFACLIARLQEITAEAGAMLAPGTSEWQKAYEVRKLHAETEFFARELFRPANCPSAGYPQGWPGSQWPRNPADNYPQNPNQSQWPSQNPNQGQWPSQNPGQGQWPSQNPGQGQWPNPADNRRPTTYGPAAYGPATNGYSYDVEVYKRILGHSVPHNCRGAIGNDWAERVSRSVYTGEYQVEIFLNVYDRTCSEENASEIAYGVSHGTLDFEAWDTVFGYSVPHKCGAIGLKDANEVARRCARHEVRPREFLELYSRTCNVSTALSVGGRY
jgi:hypothetical protein